MKKLPSAKISQCSVHTKPNSSRVKDRAELFFGTGMSAQGFCRIPQERPATDSWGTGAPLHLVLNTRKVHTLPQRVRGLTSHQGPGLSPRLLEKLSLPSPPSQGTSYLQVRYSAPCLSHLRVSERHIPAFPICWLVPEIQPLAQGLTANSFRLPLKGSVSRIERPGLG